HSPIAATSVPEYDPKCYLCPGNVRANGERNPKYESTFVFRNDFPALGPPPKDFASRLTERQLLFAAEAEAGDCRVVCYSPRHDLHLAALSQEAVAGVVDCWADQYAELAGVPYVNAVTIFENRGAMMGASNPHPHGQIWAEFNVPNELFKETLRLRAYRAARDECLLCSYAEQELQRDERVVFANDAFVAVVPWWAIWPFEMLVIARAHRATLPELTPAERVALAATLRELVGRYDKLFGVPFPYSMGFHQAPCDGGTHFEWHLHAHYYPPLLRSADVRKYMVGYEMLAQPQRDLTPEEAAARLREL
ncbi:MAG TPA: galactose-1-phosphate uridylyltransferase, partial [Candidatus Cybelea sp.]|nr:galactose-1-phosphate uridylyltransferase [Candidatus Cybelea sp.]